MNGQRDENKNYRVHINYIDALGKAGKSMGCDPTNEKILELKLQQDIRQEAPSKTYRDAARAVP